MLVVVVMKVNMVVVFGRYSGYGEVEEEVVLVVMVVVVVIVVLSWRTD